METTTRTFDIDGPLHVDLRLDVGEILLTASPDGKAHVELDGDQDTISRTRVAVEPAGDGTRLVVHAPELRAWLLRRSGASTRVVLRVPEDAALTAQVAVADVTAQLRLGATSVQSAAGDVRLEDVTGDLTVTTAAGDVRAGYVGGDARIRTASGDVHLGAVTGEVSTKTVSGDVVVAGAAGDVSARSVSGDVVLRRVDRGDIDATSTSGDIEVVVVPGRRVHLDVSSVTGGLRSDLDADGAGGGGDGGVDLALRARTISGDVTVRRGHAARAAGGPTSGTSSPGVAIL